MHAKLEKSQVNVGYLHVIITIHVSDPLLNLLTGTVQQVSHPN